MDEEEDDDEEEEDNDKDVQDNKGEKDDILFFLRTSVPLFPSEHVI